MIVMAKSNLPVNTRTLDPHRIFGFSEALARYLDTGKLSIDQHPDLPNPRQELTEDSMTIIENVAQDQGFHTPIVVCEWKKDIIVLDGRTRLLGLIKGIGDANATDDTVTVPVVVHQIDSIEQGLVMALRLNIERVNLDETALLLLIGELHEKDPKAYTPNVLAQLIGRDHRGGIRYVKSAIAAFKSDTLRQNVKDGVIPPDVARQLGTRNDTEEEIQAAVDRTVQKANKIKKESAENGKEVSQEEAVKKAAKVTGSARSNHTAMTLPDLRHRIAQGLSEMCTSKIIPQEDRASMRDWLTIIAEADENAEIKAWPDFSAEGEYVINVLMTRVVTLAEAANYAVETLGADNLRSLRTATTIRNVMDAMTTAEQEVLFSWRSN